jgi:hypothetical protein
MACRASDRTLTRALEVDIVLVRERKQVVALAPLNRLDQLAVRADKVDLDAGRVLVTCAGPSRVWDIPLSGLWVLQVAVAGHCGLAD